MNKTEYLLACLAEECSEVQHQIGKALRFGLDDNYPGHDTPENEIINECGDVIAVLEMLVQEGILKNMPTEQRKEEKKARVLKYMLYAVFQE